MLAVFRRLRLLDSLKENPLLQGIDFGSEATRLQALSLQEVSQLQTTQIIIRTVQFAMPSETGAMPSTEDAKKAFEAADIWLHRANVGEQQISGQVDAARSEIPLEIPLALYVNLAINCQEFDKANDELEKIEIW
jgi:hypothetical protein